MIASLYKVRYLKTDYSVCPSELDLTKCQARVGVVLVMFNVHSSGFEVGID